MCLATGSVVPLPYRPGHTEQGWGRGGLPESWEDISHLGSEATSGWVALIPSIPLARLLSAPQSCQLTSLAGVMGRWSGMGQHVLRPRGVAESPEPAC